MWGGRRWGLLGGRGGFDLLFVRGLVGRRGGGGSSALERFCLWWVGAR